MHYIDGFHEEDADLIARDVDNRFIFDIQASYDFSALVQPATSGGYSKDAKGGAVETGVSESMSVVDHLLKGTTLTVGCTNLFDTDPPFASGQGGNASGYPGFTYDSTGQFVYIRLTKKF